MMRWSMGLSLRSSMDTSLGVRAGLLNPQLWAVCYAEHDERYTPKSSKRRRACLDTVGRQGYRTRRARFRGATELKGGPMKAVAASLLLLVAAVVAVGAPLAQ